MSSQRQCGPCTSAIAAQLAVSTAPILRKQHVKNKLKVLRLHQFADLAVMLCDVLT